MDGPLGESYPTGDLGFGDALCKQRQYRFVSLSAFRGASGVLVTGQTRACPSLGRPVLGVIVLIAAIALNIIFW